MKSKNWSVVLLLALPFSGFLAGCDASNKDSSYSNSTNTVSETTNASAVPDTNATTSNVTGSINRDADNSGLNVRDRDTNNLTPGDQGTTAADIDVTQKIRKGIVEDTNYSITAKNIKIITVDGKVTLRGPVNSDSEKSGIETLAKNIAGDGNVDSQLEVKSNP